MSYGTYSIIIGDQDYKVNPDSGDYWRDGLVQVYDWNKNNSTWTQRGDDIVGPSGTGTGFPEFAGSTALSENGMTMVVGARGYTPSESGWMQVYDWNENTSSWTQRGDDIVGGTTGDAIGVIVSISEDGNTVAANGSYITRIFDWNSGSSEWTQRGSDLTCGTSQVIRSSKLSRDGDAIIMKAKQVTHYRVWSGTSWDLQYSDNINTTTGSAISYAYHLADIDNTTSSGRGIVVGGDTTDKARVYTHDSGTTWTQRGSTISGIGKHSAAINQDSTVVALGTRDTSSGSVKVYEWNGISWSQRGSTFAGTGTGRTVALNQDGDVVMMKTPNNSVSIYEWDTDTSSWSQLGDSITTTNATASFGRGVISVIGDITATAQAIGDPTTAHAIGDPHIQTFSGLKYTL